MRIPAEPIAISEAWTDAKVVDNTIHDSFNGIVLFGGGSPELMGNEVAVDGYGIDIGANTSPSVDGNSVCGGNGSIKIYDTATPLPHEGSQAARRWAADQDLSHPLEGIGEDTSLTVGPYFRGHRRGLSLGH